jgi:hypothetical protein
MKSHEYGVKFTVNNFIDIFIMVKALKRIFNECEFKEHTNVYLYAVYG